VHLCSEWRNFILKSATRNGLGARARISARRRTLRATSSPQYPGCARTPRHREIQRSEAHAVTTVHLRPMMRVRGLGWRHAACAHSPAGEPPFSIGRRLRRTSPPPRAHIVTTVGHDATRNPLDEPRGYKTPLPHSLARPSHPPPFAISATSELLAPLAPEANQ
jgi:hypothetical protein